MGKVEIVTGTLIDERTVSLDTPTSLSPTKVRIVIEPLEPGPRRSYRPEVVSAIHAAQRRRGHQPPSREEVDRRMQAERDGWGE